MCSRIRSASDCALDVWQGLDADFFSRLRARLARKPALLSPLKPRPHQRDAAKAGHHHYVIKKEPDFQISLCVEFKQDWHWSRAVDVKRVENFMTAHRKLAG